MLKQILAGLSLGFWVWIRTVIRKLERLLILRYFDICLSCYLTPNLINALEDYLNIRKTQSSIHLKHYLKKQNSEDSSQGSRASLEEEAEALQKLFYEYNHLIKKWYYIFGISLSLVFVIIYLILTIH